MKNTSRLDPFYKKTVWGSETWLVSTHENGETFFEESRLPFLLNYLVKKIDSNQNLSIQVHPYEENSKNECWLITKSTEDAGIFLGFKEGITKEILKEDILLKKDISELLKFIPVKKGDFFFVPAGGVHAIGKGVELLEIQESSDVTYRVWDWNRKGMDGQPRQLHLEQALDVLDFTFTSPYHVKVSEIDQKELVLVNFNNIEVSFLKLSKGETYSIELSNKSSVINVKGSTSIESNLFGPFEAFFSINKRELDIMSLDDSEIIIVRCKNE